MRRLAPIILSVAWVAGCGDQPPPPAAVVAERTAPMSCESGWSWGYKPQAEGVQAGPIRLLRLDDHAGARLDAPRAFYTKVVLAPRATTTVAVAPEDRHRVRLATQPPSDPTAAAGGGAAIRFEGCAPRVDDSREGEELGTGYAIAVMVDSPGCATFEITPEGGEPLRRTVPFGVQDCA